MGDDRLTIVVPIFNASRTLSATLDSLGCIHPEHRGAVQVIGVDDGSSDGSGEIFSRHPIFTEGVRSTLITRANGGSGAARNTALKTFTTGWTMFLDADDELAMDPCPLLMEYRDHSALVFDVQIFRSGRLICTNKASRVNPGTFSRTFSAGNPFHPASVIFRRELITNFFKEDLIFLEDWHFWWTNPRLFVAMQAFPGVCLSHVFAGPNNKSSDQIKVGRYRLVIADLMERGCEGREMTVRNNIFLQKAIACVQMGERRRWKALLSFPVTPALYGKLLVYFLMFPLYRLFNPYGIRKS